MSTVAVELPESFAAVGSPAFEAVFKAEVARLGADALPLRLAMTQGNYVLDEGLEVMVLKMSETPQAIHVKAGIHFRSLVAGCACDGDPTPTPEINEYGEALVTIDRRTGAATIGLVSD